MTDDQKPDTPPERELKDQRIPIMMTASELKAIDDWSFENRIRSRAEAIRRLIQVGLATDSKTIDFVASELGQDIEMVDILSLILNEFSEKIMNENENYDNRLVKQMSSALQRFKFMLTTTASGLTYAHGKLKAAASSDSYDKMQLGMLAARDRYKNELKAIAAHLGAPDPFTEPE